MTKYWTAYYITIEAKTNEDAERDFKSIENNLKDKYKGIEMNNQTFFKLNNGFSEAINFSKAVSK